MSATNGTPPIEYPRITVGGVEYEVKFGHGTFYRMDMLKEARSNGGLSFVVQVLACSVGHSTESKWRPVHYDAEQFADDLSDTSYTFEDLMRIMNEAQAKAPPALRKALAAPAEVGAENSAG